MSVFFKSLTENLIAVRNAADKSQKPDSRLRPLNTLSSSVAGSDGAFLLSPVYSRELLEMAYKTAIIANKCFKSQQGGSSEVRFPQISEQSREQGSRYGGVSSAWLAERGQIPESFGGFAMSTQKLNKLGVAVNCTNELMADFPGLDAFIQKCISDEFATVLDTAIIRADGVGKPLGILNSPALITVEKEGGQLAGTIVLENVLKMISRFDVRSWDNAAFFVNLNTLEQLYKLELFSGVAGSSVNNVGSSSTGLTLAGRPVIPVEQCSSVGTLGDIILADMGQYALVDRPLNQEVSIHVRFITDESIFRFVLHVNGQPIWSSPITPMYGTADTTVSPFVALATRD